MKIRMLSFRKGPFVLLLILFWAKVLFAGADLQIERVDLGRIGSFPQPDQARTQAFHVAQLPETEISENGATLKESRPQLEPEGLQSGAQNRIRSKALPSKTNHSGPGLGIASFVLGILSFVLMLGFSIAPFLIFIGLVTAILAIAFGAKGKAKGRSGRGLALAGMIIGIVVTVLILQILFVYLIIFGTDISIGFG
jgi:hypothetical protein